MAMGNSRRGVELLAGRWTVAVLGQLAKGGRRYQDLIESLDGVSRKVLTETLRRAERDGLIVRRVDPDRIGTVTLYELTDLGLSLDEPLVVLERWVGIYWPRVEAARGRWSRRGD